jgi:Caspase domain
MDRSALRLAAFFIVAIALVLAQPARADKRVALVIGNDGYSNVPALRKAAGDARAVADTLRRLGFKVLVAENQTRRAMSETLLVFDSMVEKGDTALFFFAGHGFEIKGENYLLPTDVPAALDGQQELVRDASFPAQRIIDRLQARGARTAILVLDACRNNPFEQPGKRGVSGRGGLAAMQPSEGVFVIFSAGAKQTALDRLSDDDRNPNSVFTRNFVRELATPGLTLVQVAKRTQADVKRMADTVHHYQTPAYYDQIVGDVFLNGAASDAPKTNAAPQVAMLPPSAPNAIVRPAPAPAGPINAPIANFMRSNSGWTVSLSFADPVAAISWRLGDKPFKETGFLDVLDPRTRRRMPNPSFQLDADTPASMIEVRAIGPSGETLGPYPIRFDPMAALVHSQRKMLEMTAGSWLMFRQYNGLLLYYTQLASNRCAIRAVKIGIDTSVPDRALALPACDPKNPYSIPAKLLPYMKLPPSVRSVSVELTYRDGTVSEVKTFRH